MNKIIVKGKHIAVGLFVFVIFSVAFGTFLRNTAGGSEVQSTGNAPAHYISEIDMGDCYWIYEPGEEGSYWGSDMLEATAECAAGDHVISGGCRSSSVTLFENRPGGEDFDTMGEDIDGWYCIGEDSPGFWPWGMSGDLSAYALCCPGPEDLDEGGIKKPDSNFDTWCVFEAPGWWITPGVSKVVRPHYSAWARSSKVSNWQSIFCQPFGEAVECASSDHVGDPDHELEVWDETYECKKKDRSWHPSDCYTWDYFCEYTDFDDDGKCC